MKTYKVTKTYYNGKSKSIYIKGEFQIDAELMCKAYFTMYEGIKSLELTYRNKTHLYMERE